MDSPFPSEIQTILSILRANTLAHALIGGWAVVAWGVVRASEDIDFLIELPAEKRKPLLAGLSREFQAEWIQGEPGDPLPGLIRAIPKTAGMPIDLLPARSNADIGALDRAKIVTLGSIEIPIVAPEDLIAMKLEAGGGQDYEDARNLLSILSENLEAARLQESCRERNAADRLALLTKA